MTQIRSIMKPTRRPGELGVHSLDSFNLIVPDMAIARNFYANFGLNLCEAGNQLDVRTFGHFHRWGTISEGPSKRLSHLSFGVFEDDFESFRQHLQACGVQRIDPPPGLESDGLWFRNPDGLLIELRVADKTTLNEKADFANPSAPPGQQGAPARSSRGCIQPRRLSHMLIFTTDVPGAIRFYERVLGLRLADRAGDGVAFMYAIHGCDHHLLALVQSDGPGLHHVSWDVGSIHDIGVGAMQMADHGYSAGWGLGRHVLGSNYFHYVRDPWGSYAEYSSDIDYIPANCDWLANDNPAHDSFYVWGPTPPQDFAHNYEISNA